MDYIDLTDEQVEQIINGFIKDSKFSNMKIESTRNDVINPYWVLFNNQTEREKHVSNWSTSKRTSECNLK